MKTKLLFFVSFFLLTTLLYSFADNKTWQDCFYEAEKRLEANPIDSNFKIDPEMFGSWVKFESDIENYTITFTYLTLKEDGTGVLDIMPMYLTEQKTFTFDEKYNTKLDFYWGVDIQYDDNDAPVVIIKLIFSDNTFLWLYYGKFDDGYVSLCLYDEATEEVGLTQAYYDANNFLEEWEANWKNLANIMHKNRKVKKEVSHREFDRLFFNNMFYNTFQNSYITPY